MLGDPLMDINRLLRDPVAYAMRPRGSGMSDQEYDSLLGRLTNAPMSALGWIGDTLDKPGRAVRGLLAGRPEELANLIPFSNTLGITDSEGWLGGTPLQISDRENAVTGRDLLREHGLIDDEDTWGNFLGGMATEIATDPLTYLSLGTGAAATQGGKLLTKAGLMPATHAARLSGTLGSVVPHLDDAARVAMQGGDDVADVLRMLARGSEPTEKLLAAARGSGVGIDDLLRMKDEPLTALAKYGWGENAVRLGLGEAGLPVGRALDAAQDAVRWSGPGKLAAKLFSQPAANRATETGQRAAGEMNQSLDAGLAALRRLDADARLKMPEMGFTEDVMNKIGLDVAEQSWPGAKQTIAERTLLAESQGKTLSQLAIEESLSKTGYDVGKFQTRKAAEIIDTIRNTTASLRARADALGLPASMLDDTFVPYWHRQLLDNQTPAASRGQRVFPTVGPQDSARTFREIPGGAGTLQRAFGDDEVRTLLKATKEADLLEGLTDWQAAYLYNHGIPNEQLTDLTKWQARSMIADIEAGRPPIAHRMPPERASRPPLKAVETIWQRYLDTSPDGSEVTKFKELQEKMREGVGMGATLEKIGTGEIPEAVYRHAKQAGYLAEDVNQAFAEKGWRGVTELMTSDVNTDIQDALLKELGMPTGRAALDEAQSEMYEALRGKRNQALQVARFMHAHPDARYATDILGAAADAATAELRKIEAAEAIYRHIGRVAEAMTPDTPSSAQLSAALQGKDLPTGVQALLAHKKPVPEGFTRIVDALQDIGIGTGPEQGAKAILRLADELAQKGFISGDVLTQLRNGDGAALVALDNVLIPTDVARDFKGLLGGLNAKKELGPILGAWDAITNVMKANLTVPFPAFSARNTQSLFWQDGVTGGFMNPVRMIQRWRDANTLLRGGEIAGASQWPIFAGMNLSDKEATRQLSALMAGHRVSPHGFGEALEVVGSASKFASENPLGSFKGYNVLSDYVPRKLSDLNPLKVRGGLMPPDARTSEFFLARGGEKLTTYTEALGRTATFLRKVSEGVAPEQAALISRAAHVPFDQLTQFEKEVMRRIIPFYTYTRHIVPWHLKELAEQPGGLIAQSIRATTTTDEGFTPEQAVGSIPIGQETDGTRRYLGLDLPFNVLNDVAGKGRGILGTMQQTGYRWLSQTNPLLKAPAELVTGQSFFQRGRPLVDLYSRTGLNDPLLDSIIMNSPASRYISTAGMLMDERKTMADRALNLFGGMRVSDIDVDLARERAGARVATDMLREGGAKTFQKMYFPEGYLPTPEEEQLMALLQAQAQRRRAGN